MTRQALLLGSIGTLVETSDLQRQAFNEAFAKHDLDWYWNVETYTRLLQISGGQKRIADYAEEVGASVDVEAIHADKVAIFDTLLQDGTLKLRAGVRNLIDAAHQDGIPVGFVTGTSTEQTQAIFEALGDTLTRDDFAYIGDATKADQPKPAPDIYHDALTALGVAADQAIAIEDSPSSADAALAAGIETVATPGALHMDSPFPTGVRILEVVSPDLLTETA